MEIATFKVPASNELEVINTSTLIKGLTGSKVISVKIEFEKSENEKWWHVIVMYESPYTPPPPPPPDIIKENLKRAFQKWINDAHKNGESIKRRMVETNIDKLLFFHNEILFDIHTLLRFKGVGPKAISMYGKELCDVIRQAINQPNADEPDATEN